MKGYNIQMYLNEIVWDGVNLIHLAQDRDRWKNFSIQSYPKEYCFLEGSQVSPICPSGESNMYMKMSVELYTHTNQWPRKQYL